MILFQLRDAPQFLLGLVGVDLGRRLELGHAPPQRASRDLLRLLGLVADLERSCDRFCDAADRFSEAALDAATAAARRAGVAPGARAALAETTLTAALPAYVDGVRAAGASWRRLAGQFVDALRAECRVQRGSHLADLLARLQDHD